MRGITSRVVAVATFAVMLAGCSGSATTQPPAVTGTGIGASAAPPSQAAATMTPTPSTTPGPG